MKLHKVLSWNLMKVWSKAALPQMNIDNNEIKREIKWLVAQLNYSADRINKSELLTDIFQKFWNDLRI